MTMNDHTDTDALNQETRELLWQAHLAENRRTAEAIENYLAMRDRETEVD